MMFMNQQPLNPQQLARLQRRMNSAEDLIYGGSVPSNMGEGLQQLGTAVGLAAMRRRYNSQFPAAPGGAPPAQSILESLSGDRMPWQFPKAPTPPPAAGATPRMGALAQVNPSGGGFLQRMGGVLGFGGLFGPKTGGGLY